jgi:DNA phosphorothioation-associated putative methyltransferase
VKVDRHKTALHRVDLSRPVRLAVEEGLITRRSCVFDYGCGLGGDVQRLRERGIKSWGWDPVHAPKERLRAADVVNFGYVANVIERPSERTDALRSAWTLAKQVLVIAARISMDARGGVGATFEDGYVTQLGTFQKYFEQTELREWIDQTLGVASVPSAPGVFYVFRDAELRERYLAARYQRRLSAPRIRRSDVLFEAHRPLFDALRAFLLSRGRPPVSDELEEAAELAKVLGSIPRAFAVLRRVTRSDEWEVIREARSQDLLLYFALARFDGRPRFSQLPREMQIDVRAFFGNYRRACDRADDLLFSAGDRSQVEAACRASRVGKVTPTALYVHESALPELPPILRVYEGCARRYVGAVSGANVIKLYRDGITISYLSYPTFERDPHPSPAASLMVSLQSFRLSYRDYRTSSNPPILHRKEQFLAAEHPLRARFSRLTRQEERSGLFEAPEMIGTREAWEQVLTKKGLRLVGHRLCRQTGCRNQRDRSIVSPRSANPDH